MRMRLPTWGGVSTCREMAEAADGDRVVGEGSAAPPVASSATPITERPTCVICLGMAGSGKTTFVQVKIEAGYP